MAISFEKQVKEKFPKAYANKHQTNSNKTYYLIYADRKATMYMASGDTKPLAWKNAADLIKNIQHDKDR